MGFRALEGQQTGLSVAAMQISMCDDWGENPDSQAVKNSQLRRINRAIRKIHLTNPRRRIFLVVDAEAPIIAGIADYDVRRIPDNGGFAWTDCMEIVRFRSEDGRPLETVDVERFRERNFSLAVDPGAPQMAVLIDPLRVKFHPTPTEDGMLLGEYYTELPSLDQGVLSWPRSWDEAILAGANYYTALAKFADNPANIIQFKREFDEIMRLIDDNEDAPTERPGRVVNTRYLRSVRQGPPSNRGTDWRG